MIRRRPSTARRGAARPRRSVGRPDLRAAVALDLDVRGRAVQSPVSGRRRARLAPSTRSSRAAVAALDARALDHRHAVAHRRARRSASWSAGSRRGRRGTCRARAPRRSRVADDEVAAVLLDALDVQDGVDEQRALDLGGTMPGHEVDALDRHRPALGQRALDRGLDADEHAARLLEEAASTSPGPPASKLETCTTASRRGK